MDKLTLQQRSENMRRIRSKGTKPEIEVRRLIYRLGYRYRLHVKTLSGKPDLVFHSRGKVIFVHGCFWHQHCDPACKKARKPTSNVTFWNNKLKANAERDERNMELLLSEGWQVLTIWQCQIKNAADLSDRIKRFLN